MSGDTPPIEPLQGDNVLQYIKAAVSAVHADQLEEDAVLLAFHEQLIGKPSHTQYELLPKRLAKRVADMEQQINTLRPPGLRGPDMKSWIPLTKRLDAEYWSIMSGIRRLPEFRRGSIFEVVIDLGMLRYVRVV